jgi:endonuclease III
MSNAARPNMNQSDAYQQDHIVEQRSRLSDAVRQVFERKEVTDKFCELKLHQSDFDDPNFVWNAIVVSASTMGNASGYERLIANPINRAKMDYEKVMNHLPAAERETYIAKVLKQAGVRFPNMKAAWLEKNLQILANEGGPVKMKEVLEEQSGTTGKVSYLTQFYGIGKKYGRNILMDVYHSDFRNCIAVDARMHSMSKHLELTFATYEAEEQFYLDVAKIAGVDGWELDRLIFHFGKEVRDKLDQDIALAA